MDDSQIQTTLAAVAPVTTGMSIGAVIDAALATVDPPTLKMLIDARLQRTTKATAIASIPTVPTPANAVAIYDYILNTVSEPDVAAALLAVRNAARGASASPATNTFAEVFSALLYLPTVLHKAMPDIG